MVVLMAILYTLVFKSILLQTVVIGNVAGLDNIGESDTGSNVYPTPEVRTKNVTAHYCPFPCTMGNETVCVPPPCPPPACVDPARVKPTDCCVFCPNGPDCSSPDGGIIHFDHWKIVGNKNCTCLYPSQPATCV